MSDTLVIASRYRLKRAYVAKLLKERGVKESARARAAELGISPPVAWRLFHEPEPGEAEFFAGPNTVNAVCSYFDDQDPGALWEAA